MSRTSSGQSVSPKSHNIAIILLKLEIFILKYLHKYCILLLMFAVPYVFKPLKKKKILSRMTMMWVLQYLIIDFLQTASGINQKPFDIYTVKYS